MRLAMLALALVLVPLTSATAETLQLTVAPRSQDAFGRAIYRLWLPPGDAPLRAIIVRQHGCGPGARKLGLEHADDIQWQALAAKWNCGLLGSQLWAPGEDCSTWTIPQDGSEYAFLTALSRFAALSGREEIATVPWCLWGHSGGAMWVCNMTYTHPDRVVAAFPRSGGLSPIARQYTRSRPYDADSRPQAFTVPMLFCHGETEHQPQSRFFKGIEGAHHTYRVGRLHAAPWAILSHPNSDHENANSRLIAIRYFDAMLKDRIDDRGQLIPIDRGNGVLVNHQTNESRAIDAKLASQPDWSWLPNDAVAKAFIELQKTGDLTDETPPPAPTAVTVVKRGEQRVLTWLATADVESGVSRFEVLRGEQVVGRVGGPVDRRWNPDGHFHSWNYSDQPLRGRELPAMEFAIPADAAAAEFSVRTVNRAGLMSPPSPAAIGE